MLTTFNGSLASPWLCVEKDSVVPLVSSGNGITIGELLLTPVWRGNTMHAMNTPVLKMLRPKNPSRQSKSSDTDVQAQ